MFLQQLLWVHCGCRLCCRCFKVWTICIQSVTSSTPTLNQRTFWWVWMSPTSGSWRLKPQSGRGLERRLPLAPQVWHAHANILTCAFQTRLCNHLLPFFTVSTAPAPKQVRHTRQPTIHPNRALSWWVLPHYFSKWKQFFNTQNCVHKLVLICRCFH